MQRQSLGSPSSRHSAISGDSPSPFLEEMKAPTKPAKTSHRTANSVHIIPVLTLLCFLVLYLSSHDPSPSDLVSFSGSVIHSKVKNEIVAATRGLKADPDLLRIRKMGIR